MERYTSEAFPNEHPSISSSTLYDFLMNVILHVGDDSCCNLVGGHANMSNLLVQVEAGPQDEISGLLIVEVGSIKQQGG